jgi:hypothetical protein
MWTEPPKSDDFVVLIEEVTMLRAGGAALADAHPQEGPGRLSAVHNVCGPARAFDGARRASVRSAERAVRSPRRLKGSRRLGFRSGRCVERRIGVAAQARR